MLRCFAASKVALRRSIDPDQFDLGGSCCALAFGCSDVAFGVGASGDCPFDWTTTQSGSGFYGRFDGFGFIRRLAELREPADDPCGCYVFGAGALVGCTHAASRCTGRIVSFAGGGRFFGLFRFGHHLFCRDPGSIDVSDRKTAAFPCRIAPPCDACRGGCLWVGCGTLDCLAVFHVLRPCQATSNSLIRPRWSLSEPTHLLRYAVSVLFRFGGASGQGEAT